MKCKATDLAEESGMDNPKWLISREFGRRFLPVLQEKMELLQQGESLELSFEGIDLLEWSFADEAIVALCVKLVSGQFLEKYIILEDLSSTSIENLTVAIKTRPERENKTLRNLIVPVIINDELVPVGKLEDHLKPVWEFARENQQFTARDLSTELGLEINTSSTKLKSLFDLRLLKRVENISEAGKQYIYSKL